MRTRDTIMWSVRSILRPFMDLIFVWRSNWSPLAVVIELPVSGLTPRLLAISSTSWPMTLKLRPTPLLSIHLDYSWWLASVTKSSSSTFLTRGLKHTKAFQSRSVGKSSSQMEVNFLPARMTKRSGCTSSTLLKAQHHSNLLPISSQ